MHIIGAEYLGQQHFATIMGWMDLFRLFAAVLGPVFAGWIFDVTGSYRLAFITFAIPAAIAMVLILIIQRPVLTPKAT